MKKRPTHPPRADDFSENQIPKGLVLCLLNEFGAVTEQNEACQKLCGVRIGMKCTECCGKQIAQAPQAAMKLHHNGFVQGRASEIAEIRSGPDRLIAIQLHEACFQKEFEAISHHGLTPSEEKVIKLKIAGFSIEKIAEALFVSVATVKTHLLHAYQKLPAQVVDKISHHLPSW